MSSLRDRLAAAALAPESHGKAVLDIAADDSLCWSYHASRLQFETFGSRKAASEPALGEAELGRALPSWKSRGRVTLRLDKQNGIHWTLESGDGSSFEPLPTRW